MMNTFQELLNAFENKGIAGPANLVPSQMPRAMGGGFNHGIAGNMSDMYNRPFGYGMKGGVKQMPYIYDERDEEQKVLEQMPYVGNTFSLINFLKGIEG